MKSRSMSDVDTPRRTRPGHTVRRAWLPMGKRTGQHPRQSPHKLCREPNLLRGMARREVKAAACARSSTCHRASGLLLAVWAVARVGLGALYRCYLSWRQIILA